MQSRCGDLAARNQMQDEADVTTGWHAIEFLLWGQDLQRRRPGRPPVTDYVAGQPATTTGAATTCGS